MNYSIRNIDAALLDAAKRGDLNEAKRLIIEEADVNMHMMDLKVILYIGLLKIIILI